MIVMAIAASPARVCKFVGYPPNSPQKKYCYIKQRFDAYFKMEICIRLGYIQPTKMASARRGKLDLTRPADQRATKRLIAEFSGVLADMRHFNMRLMLITAIAAILISTWLPAAAIAASLDTPLVLGDDGERKRDTVDDEEHATGDEEPECE